MNTYQKWLNEASESLNHLLDNEEVVFQAGKDMQLAETLLVQLQEANKLIAALLDKSKSKSA